MKDERRRNWMQAPGFKRERKIKAKYVSFKAPLFI